MLKDVNCIVFYLLCISAPGNFRLSVSFWFYGIFIALILIIAFMVIFIVAKKTTDINHKQKGKIQPMSMMIID